LKKSSFSRERDEIARQKALLATLSEDLALPLLQVRSSIELLQNDNFAKPAARRHALESSLNLDAGLQLIEAYRLLLNSAEIDKLPLEPLAIGALLEDIAHKLTPYAKQYSTQIEVSVQHRLAPVVVHQPSLLSAMEVLSSSLIRAQSAQSDDKSYRILLGAHKTADNAIAAGVFSSVNGLSDKTLRAARSLVGKARQPLPAVPAGAAAGVLVADMLCAALWQPLRAAAHDNLAGLATSIPASKQLQFV
jgi:K+-sensing histidine kinase KdpD